MTSDELGNAPAETPQPRIPKREHGVLLTLAYDGHLFHGIARQQGLRTIAGEVDGAIRAMDPQATLLRVCSRTDKGVHARGQLAAFDTNKQITPRGWLLGLSQHLPDEISVVRVAQVRPGVEPSHLAKKKWYRYVLLCSDARDPFWERRAWRHYARLDLELMRAEAADLIGEHDFAAFRGAKDERTETVRRILRASLEASQDDPRVVYFDIEGNRFMYNMVRIIIGTLVDVGRGRLAPGAVKRALQSLDRNHLGMTAPPDGLYLQAIDLDVPLDNVWPSSGVRLVEPKPAS
ncbi:MAG: tRNA pseudouridine(38-40) synthase TruA [Polyangiaceae bacterium]|nr:tRNA pseudouridine(38-40) synthase TruA [Polyangiaceae bacterium]